MAPGNKGLRLPAETLPLNAVEALLGSFGTSATDSRNYAIVCLVYRAGLSRSTSSPWSGATTSPGPIGF